ncbi:hypothetical protein PsorP6_007297 [Peronosclerospora sorghi]|uniref:Uncharacterized protein n=1 Tax=Peronosclerospora sorghi TaxID=230839 RepID=A0ACC0W959_9STRA|nr:hypothetical protein PsorP6_007297 [Peronosclerospora sorghi]
MMLSALKPTHCFEWLCVFKVMTKVQERLAVLSLNVCVALSCSFKRMEIFCRPEGIHSGEWFKTGDYKDLRVTLLLRKMAQFDLVMLQEMFEAGPRQQRFVRDAHALGFHYHCGSVWPRLWDSRLIDGGLLILSRYPIVERDQLVYSEGSGSDGMCAKGVLYARIQLSPDRADSLHVFTTHTQAGDNYNEYRIRLAQIQEMHRFIATRIRQDPDIPMLITGDFNLDARHNLVHDAQTGALTSSRCRESDVYRQLVADFERVVREARRKGARQSTEGDSPLIVDLMKQCDTTKLGDEIHPITNGDGHSLLVHTGDPLSLEKDGKCIDYMFLVPGGMKDQTLVSHSSTDSTKNMTRCQLTLVEKGTTVDHCSVTDLTPDNTTTASTSACPQDLPITHLSDHYGLRALFSLDFASLEHPDGRPVGPNEPLYSVLQLYFPHHALAQQPRRLWKWKLAAALIGIVAATGGTTLVVVQGMLKVVFEIAS